MKALAELIELQRKKVITIKPCDKGAGIIILDLNIRACQEHLGCLQLQQDGSRKPYYQKVGEDALDEIKTKVNHVVEEAFDNGILKKEEYEAMSADEKAAAGFMLLSKFISSMKLARHPLKGPS